MPLIHNPGGNPAIIPRRNPSGSSGGTGVGIVANFDMVGIGEDTGGSIRGPAAVASLVGLCPHAGAGEPVRPGARMTRPRPASNSGMLSIPFALPLLATLACQPDNSPPTALQSEIRDSAGIRIVENPAPPAGSRLGWRIGPEPRVSIGEREGEAPYLLYRVMDATILADGRIVVANSGSDELRFFDSTGSHLASRGGRGEGPGEFEGLHSVAPWAGDSIVAWFAPGMGVSVFDGEGTYGRTIAIDHTTRSWWLQPTAASVHGSILAVYSWEDRDTLVLQLLDGEGAVRTSLETLPSWEPHLMHEGTEREILYWKTFGREPVWGLWGDLVVFGVSNRYEIRAFGADGSLTRVVRREHRPRSPTPDDLDAFIEDRRVRYNDSDLSAYRSVPVAEYFPAFATGRDPSGGQRTGEIMTDAVDHLWIREYDLPGEERAEPLWTVFDPEGRVLGFMETPPGLVIFEIGEDYIMGISWDELYVEYVQVWPLERSDPAR